MAHKKTLTFDEVAALAESVGLPGVTFAQIAKGESGFQVGAVGHDPGGTRGLGLFQITTHYNDDVIKQFGGEHRLLTDPYANARAAKAIYDRQGIKAWYGTRYLTDPKAHYKGDLSAGQFHKTQSMMFPGSPGKVLPGESHQADRGQAVANWLLTRMHSNPATASLGLAAALNAIPSDTASQRLPGLSPVPGPPAGAPSRTPGKTTKTAKPPSGAVLDPGGQKVAAWIEPILAYARKHGWKGTINSGYRSDAEQTRIYKSGVRPAALPRSMGGGGSNHEFTAYPGGAIDVTDPQVLARILQNSKYRTKLVYAGAKDPVHFSHPHNGSY